MPLKLVFTAITANVRKNINEHYQRRLAYVRNDKQLAFPQ